jgi:hypothetical protein
MHRSCHAIAVIRSIGLPQGRLLQGTSYVTFERSPTLGFVEERDMRLSPTVAAFAFACALLCTGIAGADTVVTIDGEPVTGAIVHEGHILVPFRAPMEQLGATVVWVDAARTGTATYAGQELVRAIVDSPTAYIGGYAKALTVAPLLIEPQHLEYIPVEMLPEISNAKLTVSPDGNSATITDFDLAGVNAIGSGAANNDPGGKVLYVWVWLLPISGVLCIVAYVVVIGQLNRSFAAAAARSGKPIKGLGLLV